MYKQNIIDIAPQKKEKFNPSFFTFNQWLLIGEMKQSTKAAY